MSQKGTPKVLRELSYVYSRSTSAEEVNFGRHMLNPQVATGHKSRTKFLLKLCVRGLGFTYALNPVFLEKWSRCNIQLPTSPENDLEFS